jgi:hypothetical protein
MIKLAKLLVGSSHQISNLRLKVMSNPHFHHLVTCAFDPVSALMDDEEYKCYYKSIKSYYVLHQLGSIPTVFQVISSAFQRIDQYISADIAKKCTGAQIDALYTPYLRIFTASNVSLPINALEDRYKQLQLPFKLLHGVVRDEADVNALINEVPFKAENLVTMGGKRVTERRETCITHLITKRLKFQPCILLQVSWRMQEWEVWLTAVRSCRLSLSRH